MSAASSQSPYFDFESHAKSPDDGFLASDDHAFAFKPLARKFHEFRFFECSTHFFIFGSDAGCQNITLLEIRRDQGKIQINSVVTIPDHADDVRYADCKGIVVGQVPAVIGKWIVQVTLANGETEVSQMDVSSLVFDGTIKWCTQEFRNENDYNMRVKELSCRYPVGWQDHPNFDGIIGFARFTDEWCAMTWESSA
jgi:hypothetical protein